MGPVQFCALMTVVLAGETFPLAVETAVRSAALTATVRAVVSAAVCGTPFSTKKAPAAMPMTATPMPLLMS